jgi:hypothetical protein
VFGSGLKLFWPDHPEGDNLSFIPSLGVEAYYRNESYASVRLWRDPRPGTGITFRIANRFGTATRHFDCSLAPRTDGVVGWGLYGRWDWFMAGLARETDYDFTNIDRRTIFFGFLYDLQPRP